MNTQETNAKTRIINAVKALLIEGCSSSELTVREIAEKAKVGIGTINYHFQSKDRLVYEAGNSLLMSMAENLSINTQTDRASPYEKLRSFLIDTSDLVIQHYDLYKLQINYELTQGNMTTPSYLLPLLKEMLSPGKSIHEIQIAALQLVTTMQVIFLNPGSFKSYSGIDIFSKEDRDKVIATLMDNIVNM